jgi:thioredoxin reductase
VTVVHGVAKFASSNRLVLDSGETIQFEKAIIAAGSQSAELPGTPKDPRIVDSTGALELDPLPKRMLVVGGGIIGLEMACVYSALGTAVSVVELTDALMPGTDPDLVRPFRKIIDQRYESIMLNTKVIGMSATVPGIEVAYEAKEALASEIYDKVLISIGRRANGDKLDCERAGVNVGEGGIIPVNKQMQTNVPHIFAIGDLVPGPMLAHKASHEAKVAGMGGTHGDRCQARWHQLWEVQDSLGRKRARIVIGAGRRIYEAAVRSDDQACARRGYCRTERGRAYCRDRPGNRNGRRRGGYWPDHPSSSDAFGNDRFRRRGLRRHDHRSLHAEKTLGSPARAAIH